MRGCGRGRRGSGSDQLVLILGLIGRGRKDGRFVPLSFLAKSLQTGGVSFTYVPAGTLLCTVLYIQKHIKLMRGKKILVLGWGNCSVDGTRVKVGKSREL